MSFLLYLLQRFRPSNRSQTIPSTSPPRERTFRDGPLTHPRADACVKARHPRNLPTLMMMKTRASEKMPDHPALTDLQALIYRSTRLRSCD
ncbi:hypothetical protein TNCV_447591 [Trichonephila clavipes]|nr:hypothetical protein TNCV_447591 [Trichonephila clavipes]